MSAWNRNSVSSFFPNISNSQRHRGLGDDWRMNIAFPPVNVKKKEEEFEIVLAAPGYAKEDFSIESQNGRLLISASRTEEKENKTDDFIHREYDTRSFEREILLPEHSVEQDIKATYRDGMLTITVPRDKKDLEMPSLTIPVE